MYRLRSRHIAFLCIAAMFVLIGCDQNLSFDEFKYQSIAWASLSAEEQTTITHDVSEAAVNFDDEFKDWSQQSVKAVPAVSVSFNTKDDALLGPIVVYISPKNKEVLGFGLRF